jgi:hypothetical protein
VPMRPKMNKGDWIFGVSPSRTKRRRIVFASQIAEPMTFAEAHERFPALRGPEGPVPVRPLKPAHPELPWPHSHYEPVQGSSHEGRWDRDIARRDLDRFLICRPRDGIRNTWLGADGPVLDAEILEFFNRCMVFGQSANGTTRNTGTLTAPIAMGHMYRGLHLETPQPEKLLALCEARVSGSLSPGPAPVPDPSRSGRGRGGAGPVVRRRGSSRC